MNLEEIRAREQAATPGLWLKKETADYYEIYDENSWGKALQPLALVSSSEDDVNFIIHARRDIPGLISEIDRLTAPPAPLTIEYLKQINADMHPRRWVWIQVIVPPEHYKVESAYYRVYLGHDMEESFSCGWPGLGFSFDYSEYGVTWAAYENQPKEELK